MYRCHLSVEVTESIQADVEIEFRCVRDTIDSASHWDEPEGPEFEIDSVEIILLYGLNWEKSDLGDWHEIAEDAVRHAVDCYDPYEEMCDAYTYSDPIGDL